MARSRYSQIVDLQNWNSSHSLAVLSVPPGSRVLDLGTADGSVARALKERGCTVWGIEYDEQAAEAAMQVCDRIIVADLETTGVFDLLNDETFDVVLALDILEHLRAPAPVLKRAASRLTPKGIAIVSIPNVTHGALRLSLLEGRFNYTEQGLLDRTHLRFFDRRGAERLIGEAGLTISQHLRVRRELDETEIEVNKDGVPAELLQTLAMDPDATTYQFVFVAGRRNGLPESRSGGMLSERLLAENEALTRQFSELETYAKSLQTERPQTLAIQAQVTAEKETLLAQFRELETYTKGLQTERAQTLAIQAQATAEKETLLAKFRELETYTKGLQTEGAQTLALQAQATLEKESLLARLTGVEGYARRLEADLTAVREDAARELNACRDELARIQSLHSCATAEQEELLAHFKEMETYAKELEADLTAVRHDGERELKECRDELARTQALRSLGAAEMLEAQRGRDELRNELLRRTQEAHEIHRDLKHCKADVAIKEAFIGDLRQQLLALQPVVSERDQLWLERNQLSKERTRLAARRKQLSVRHGKLLEERRRQLERQHEMEKALAALRTYVDSAGFRITEAMIRRLRHFPMVFEPTRKIARRVAGRRITVASSIPR